MGAVKCGPISKSLIIFASSSFRSIKSWMLKCPASGVRVALVKRIYPIRACDVLSRYRSKREAQD